MENYFNIRKDSSGLFENLAITKHKTFCKEWMNQYPVLFVSFKDAEGEDFEEAYRMLGYAEGLKGYEEIICYGAAFFQKQVKLRLK